MNLGTIRGIITGTLGGAQNFTEDEMNALINQAVHQISALLTPSRAPFLVARGVIGSSIINSNNDFEDVTDGSFDDWTFDGLASSGEAYSGTYAAHFNNRPDKLVSDWVTLPTYAGAPSTRSIVFSYYRKNETQETNEAWSTWFETRDSNGTQISAEQDKVSVSILPDSSYTFTTADIDFTSEVADVRLHMEVGAKPGFTYEDPRIYVDNVNVSIANREIPSDSNGQIAALYVDGYAAELVPPHRVQEITENSNSFVKSDAVSPIYAVEGTQILFGPTTATRVEALYVRRPVEMSADVNDCELPVDVQSLIFPLVAYYGALSSGNYEDAQLHQAGYIAGIQSLGLVTTSAPVNA